MRAGHSHPPMPECAGEIRGKYSNESAELCTKQLRSIGGVVLWVRARRQRAALKRFARFENCPSWTKLAHEITAQEF